MWWRGDFNASHEAPAVHTVPGDFSFRVADEFSDLSVEKLSLRTPFGSLSGSFGVVVGAPTFSELATLTEAARVGVVNFAESLASQGPPIRAYAEISFIGRHESDFHGERAFRSGNPCRRSGARNQILEATAMNQKTQFSMNFAIVRDYATGVLLGIFNRTVMLELPVSPETIVTDGGASSWSVARAAAAGATAPEKSR